MLTLWKTLNQTKIKMETTYVFMSFVFLFSLWVYYLLSTEQRIRNRYEQKLSERIAIYDKIRRVIRQISEVAVRNDESFKSNVERIMSAREDADGLLVKWVQEANPNVNFDAISGLYNQLSRIINKERNKFFKRERMLQDCKLEHDNLIKEPMNKPIFWIWGIREFDYQPIMLSHTDTVFQTGIDDDMAVFA